MKIAHLINSLTTGGAETLVVNLSALMAARGHDVSILQLEEPEPDSPPRVAALERRIPIVTLGASRFDPRIRRSLRSAQGQFDVVHAHLFPASYWAAASVRGRLFLTEHAPTNKRRVLPGMALLERRIYRRFDTVVCISDGVHDGLVKHLRGPSGSPELVVVENGIDGSRFTATSPTRGPHDPLRLLSVGSLTHRKNVGEAIHALRGLDGVTLTVVGDGSLRARLERLAIQQGVQERVRFLGRRSDVPTLMAQHHALVMTSRFEGFGLVAVEAMASGLPVLAPAIPGVGGVVSDGEAGLLHSPGDVTALRRNIVSLRDDEARRRSLAVRAIERSATYRIETTADRYLGLYKSVVGAD